MVILDAFERLPHSSLRRSQRQRHDWVRGDVRCLMCGRLLGRLLGLTRLGKNGEHSAGQPVAFIAYRALNPAECIVPFTPDLRFRCRSCGGTGALDDVDVFSTYDQPPIEQPEEPVTRRPGRPSRPMEPRPQTTGLHAALNKL
jgi:hypothetical protein